MGTDFRDFDNDGLPDIALTALAGETFPLFGIAGGELSTMPATGHDMASLSRIYSGWGIGLFDFDNDGLKDIFTANSHVNDRIDAFEATEYRQHNSIFHNSGHGQFRRCINNRRPAVRGSGARAPRLCIRRF